MLADHSDFHIRLCLGHGFLLAVVRLIICTFPRIVFAIQADWFSFNVLFLVIYYMVQKPRTVAVLASLSALAAVETDFLGFSGLRGALSILPNVFLYNNCMIVGFLVGVPVDCWRGFVGCTAQSTIRL